jgi:hypothetical protein
VSAAGAGVWSLAFLVFGEIGDVCLRDEAIVTGIAAVVEDCVSISHDDEYT